MFLLCLELSVVGALAWDQNPWGKNLNFLKHIFYNLQLSSSQSCEVTARIQVCKLNSTTLMVWSHDAIFHPILNNRLGQVSRGGHMIQFNNG